MVRAIAHVERLMSAPHVLFLRCHIIPASDNIHVLIIINIDYLLKSFKVCACVR